MSVRMRTRPRRPSTIRTTSGASPRTGMKSVSRTAPSAHSSSVSSTRPVAAIAALDPRQVGRRAQRPAAVLLRPDEGGEAGARVEPREAEPVDRPLARDERGGLEVADQPVVLDARRHGSTLPRSAGQSRHARRRPASEPGLRHRRGRGRRLVRPRSARPGRHRPRRHGGDGAAPRREARAAPGLRERRRPLRSLAPRRRRRGARREPVHAARRQQASEGNSTELLGRREARGRRAADRDVRARRSARTASASRPASSGRGWRSSSSTTAR